MKKNLNSYPFKSYDIFKEIYAQFFYLIFVRYQSLNDMVAKIVEDEKNLLASSGASSLPFQALQPHHTSAATFNVNNNQSNNIPTSINGLNDSFANKFKYNQFNSHYQTPVFKSTNNNNNNNNNTNQSDFKFNKTHKQSMVNENTGKVQVKQTASINSQKLIKPPIEENTPMANRVGRPTNLGIYSQPPLPPFQHHNHHQQQYLNHQNQQHYHQQSHHFNYNQMLAFPNSFQHQLATLTEDQQNYLLQQQRLLVIALAASEQQHKVFAANNSVADLKSNQNQMTQAQQANFMGSFFQQNNNNAQATINQQQHQR